MSGEEKNDEHVSDRSQQTDYGKIHTAYSEHLKLVKSTIKFLTIFKRWLLSFVACRRRLRTWVVRHVDVLNPAKDLLNQAKDVLISQRMCSFSVHKFNCMKMTFAQPIGCKLSEQLMNP